MLTNMTHFVFDESPSIDRGNKSGHSQTPPWKPIPCPNSLAKVQSDQIGRMIDTNGLTRCQNHNPLLGFMMPEYFRIPKIDKSFILKNRVSRVFGPAFSRICTVGKTLPLPGVTSAGYVVMMRKYRHESGFTAKQA